MVGWVVVSLLGVCFERTMGREERGGRLSGWGIIVRKQGCLVLLSRDMRENWVGEALYVGLVLYFWDKGRMVFLGEYLGIAGL